MRPKRNPDIFWRLEKRKAQQVIDALESGEDVSNEGTVVLIESGVMHQLNLLGGQIWELCDGQHSLGHILDRLSLEFDVEREVLQLDVEAFLDDLALRSWISYESE